MAKLKWITITNENYKWISDEETKKLKEEVEETFETEVHTTKDGDNLIISILITQEKWDDLTQLIH